MKHWRVVLYLLGRWACDLCLLPWLWVRVAWRRLVGLWRS